MTYNILDNTQNLNQLDWPLIEKQFGSFCFFDDTLLRFSNEKLNLSQIENFYEDQKLLGSLGHNQNVESLINDISRLKRQSSFYSFLDQVKKASYFDVDDLNNNICAFESILKNLDVLFILFPQFASKTSKQELNQIERLLKKQFRSFVNPDGSIDYFKHPKLKELYQLQLQTQQNARSLIQNSIQDLQIKDALQFEGHDLINERYVIAIKSDSYQYKFGNIISRSESGRTLFVELPQVSELNTKRLNIIIQIKKIIDSLFRIFIDELGEYLQLLNVCSYYLYRFDQVNARFLLANLYNLTQPLITQETSIKLKAFFHPLIQDAIANDFTLGKSDDGLILSGPNTGGKTAAIKSLVLIQVFIHKGLYVPAIECETFLFEHIYYFSHDNQSIEHALSSFGAEVKNYCELIEEMQYSNLIVIDEIFNSTSSEEASALAIGFIEEFLKFDTTKVLISTHHQTLKSIMHTSNKFISAHVGFNKETSAPTYKINYGTPGASLALEIFTSLSEKKTYSNTIIKKAINVLDKKMLNYEVLLEKISHKEHELNQLILENTRLRKEALNIKNSAKGLAAIKIEENVGIAQKKIFELENKMFNLLEEIKKGHLSSKSSIITKTSNLKNELASISSPKKIQKDYSNLSLPIKHIIGDKYFSTFLEQTITLKKIVGQKAFVSKGALTISCPLSSLMMTNNKDKHLVYNHISIPNNHISLEYDCRGMRLEEFQKLVDSVIVGVFNGQVPYINFIHGHGEGILKKWLRKYIMNMPEISIQKSNDGNDGQTTILLTL